MDIYEKLRASGAEVKTDPKTGILIISFSSTELTNSQLSLLRPLDNKYLLAFYGCDFTNCDISILKDFEISNIAIIYSKLTNKEMEEFLRIKKLRKIKIFDTHVTEDFIRSVQDSYPHVEIKLS